MAKRVYASGEANIQISFDDGTTFLDLKDVTSVGISVDQNREEWIPFNENGWSKNYITSKSLTFSIEKKYRADEDADKAIMDLALTGSAYDHNYVQLKFTLPQIDATATAAANLTAEVSLSVSDVLSQGSDEVASLNFEAMVNGEPTYTAEAVPSP